MGCHFASVAGHGVLNSARDIVRLHCHMPSSVLAAECFSDPQFFPKFVRQGISVFGRRSSSIAHHFNVCSSEAVLKISYFHRIRSDVSMVPEIKTSPTILKHFAESAAATLPNFKRSENPKMASQATYRLGCSPSFQNNCFSFTMGHPIFRKFFFSKDNPAMSHVSKDRRGYTVCPSASFETYFTAGLSLEKIFFLKIGWGRARNQQLF